MAKAGDGKERSGRRRRHHILQKRVDDDELARFIERSHDAGFTDHRDYLAALIAGDEGFDRRERLDLIRILGELGKQGSNLNQIAHGINAGRVTGITPDDIKKIEAAKMAVEGLGDQIRRVLQ